MGICFFCGRQPSDAAFTIKKDIYHLDKYTHLGIVRRFEYTKLSVPIERCSSCAQFQKKEIKRRKTVITLWALAGFLIGLAIPGAFLFTAILGGFIGYIIELTRAKKYRKKQGLKGLDLASLNSHPVLGQKLQSGWKLKKA